MDFKEIDLIGEETLKSMSQGVRLNKWMFNQMKPYIGDKTLEIGSGIGNISKIFIQGSKNIDLSDIRDQYVNYLKFEFPNNKVFKINLVNPDFDIAYSKILGSYNLVFALNVIEHIEDDKQAIANIFKLLKPNGYAYILVPAHQILYNNFDRALLHFRRYNKNSLRNIFPTNSKFQKSWYFNFAGIIGWFIVGSLLKRNIIPESNMKVYNFFTPFFKLIDWLTCRKIGLSVIAVYQKI